MLNLQSISHPIIAYLHHHPHSAGVITFFIAMAEALAIIGTIIPGSVTMTAVGALIGAGVIPAVSTVIWAICGAIVGDSISYLVGYYYKTRIHKIWPFSRYPHWLDKGEAFFARHGGKSVVIGRFFGPARSMVPLIAGSLNMRPIRFLLAAVPSAAAWAVAYMIPGILIGAISLELPPGMAFEFIIAVLAVIFVIVVISWLSHLAFYKLQATIGTRTGEFWQHCQKKKSLNWIIRAFSDPRHPENHRQLILLVYAVITASLFVILMLNVFAHGYLIALNNPIHYLLLSFRTNLGDNIMLLITIFGSKYVMIPSAFLLLAWFLYKKYWRTAAHWLLAIILAGGFVELIKKLHYNPRPGFLLHGPTTSSFPSGHTTLTVTFIGMLAVFFAQQLPKDTRRIPYVVAIWICCLVALSRVYLGAHWPTDVIGATLLGITICLLVTVSYRRATFPPLPVKKTFIAALIIFLMVWAADTVIAFKPLKIGMTPCWQAHKVSHKKWLNRTTPIVPLYRNNRLGRPIEAFNLEWNASLNSIKQNLVNSGWKLHIARTSFAGFMNRLATISTHHRLPLLTQLYHNRYPALLLTKDLKHNNQSVILRLWQSDITLKNSKYPLWLGVINYHLAPHKLLTPHKHFTIHKLFFGATKELTSYLENYSWKQITYKLDAQPKIMQDLLWDGKILQIGAVVSRI